MSAIRPTTWIEIYIGETQQTLHYHHPEQALVFPVSTGKNGIGETEGSEKTPRGWHLIHQKIGEGVPPNTLFKSRQPIGLFDERNTSTDPILARILTLDGLDPELNRGGNHDSLARYIYIHGTPDHCPMGVPLSHGCVRMRTADIVSLFPLIPEKTPVWMGTTPPDWERWNKLVTTQQGVEHVSLRS